MRAFEKNQCGYIYYGMETDSKEQTTHMSFFSLFRGVSIHCLYTFTFQMPLPCITTWDRCFRLFLNTSDPSI